jgi:Branched-chain amino acid ABC-type transport system, permease components
MTELGPVLQALISGALIGAVYGLVAVGLNLIYGVVHVINFAHGEFLMLSMYIALLMNALMGTNPFFALPVAVPIVMLTGLLVQRYLINRTIDAPILIQSFVTFGLLLVMQNGVMLIFGPNYYSIRVTELEGVLEFGYVRVSVGLLTAAVLSVLTILGLHLFLTRTYVGTAIRAIGQNRFAAQMIGIPVKRLYELSFAISTGLAAVAGLVLTPLIWMHPTIGEIYILKAFIIVVLGGMGNVMGAFVGGIIIGITESVSALFLMPSLKEAVALIIFIIILLFRPRGLFGRAVRI